MQDTTCRRTIPQASSARFSTFGRERRLADRGGKEGADSRADVVFMSYQQVSAILVNDQFGAGDPACQKLRCRQRIEEIAASTDDERRRLDGGKRQLVQIGAAVDIYAGEASRIAI